MKNDTVLILLSLYNGEKYISEQLDSLFNQTASIYILARDDGSKDKTAEIVEKYCSVHDNIELIRGENVGFIRSFNSLLMNDKVNEFQWIAFCDQDDVWLKDKISVAIQKLNQIQDFVPVTYCSNLRMVDESLNDIGYMHRPKTVISKKGAIVQNMATGCSMVFNKKAVDMYKKSVGKDMISHDYTMNLICLLMGKVIYDHDSYILYRQHNNNAVGGFSKSYVRGVIDVTKDLFSPKEEKRVNWIRDFYEIYKEFLSTEDVIILKRFFEYKKSFGNRLKLLFDCDYKGQDFKTTLAFKVRVLFGRMY